MRANYLFIFFTTAMLIQGCAPTPIFYHSEANLPYSNKTTKTSFELIMNNPVSVTHPIYYYVGIIAAKDNDSLSYVLLTPGKNGGSIYNLNDVEFARAVTLLPKQANAFVDILQKALDNWEKSYSGKEGINYNFSIAPENMIISASKNVDYWYSLFEFNFSNNISGASAIIFFGANEASTLNPRIMVELDEDNIKYLITSLNYAMGKKL